MMAVTVYFKYIPDCFYLEVGGITLNVIAAVTVLWLPESPEFLYGMYRFKECKTVFARIAKTNGCYNEEFDNYHLEVEDDFKKIFLDEITASSHFKESVIRKSAYHKSFKMKRSVKMSLTEIFKNKRYVNNLAICVWLWMSVFMLKPIIEGYQSLKPITNNLFDETLINFAVDLAGLLSAGYFFGKLLLRKKFIFFFTFSGIVVCIIGVILTS